MRRWMVVMGSVLVVVTACSTTRTRTPEAIAQAWAEGVRVGDTAAVSALLSPTHDTRIFAWWWERAGDFREIGRLQQFTMKHITAAGTSTNVVIEWTGSEAPVCTTVQIAPDRMVSNVSDFETCPE